MRNGRERRPQAIRVIERDLRDGRGHRCNDVGRVEPPPETYLDDRKLDAETSEKMKRGDRRGLEERELRTAIEHLLDGRKQQIIVDGLAVDLNALVEPRKVRGRVEARPHARLERHRRGHRRHAPLSVRARDVQAREAPLGMTERRDRGADPLETEQCSARREPVEPLEHRAGRRRHGPCRGSRWWAAPFVGPAWLAVPRCAMSVASVAFISGRPTMRSTMPCASKNSER